MLKRYLIKVIFHNEEGLNREDLLRLSKYRKAYIYTLFTRESINVGDMLIGRNLNSPVYVINNFPHIIDDDEAIDNEVKKLGYEVKEFPLKPKTPFY